MINELMGYISKDFYQDQDQSVQDAFDRYEEGLKLDGSQAIELKEQARHELESQLVSSGQSEEDTVFINPDEFFPSGKRDQESIDKFRREMTQSHSGQQMLWSFAGTTGAMSVLTEKHLESMGRDLDSLKPAAMRRQEKLKKTSQTNSTDPKLYLYGDGTASQTYNKEKAQLRFDRMQDTSGFNWQQGQYDPNYRVEKKNWFGAVNNDGDWVMVDQQQGKEVDASALAPEPDKQIKIVHTLDGPLIFDTALILGGEEQEEFYYTLDGDLYGAVKTDKAKTMENLQTQLGESQPVGIVIPAGTSKDIKKAYKEQFGKEVTLYEEGSKKIDKLLTTDRDQRHSLMGETLALGAVSRLKQAGLSDEKIEELLSKNQESVDVPLNPFVKEDREFIAENMSEEAQAWLDETAEMLSPEQLSHALPMVSAVLPLLATTAVSGMSDRAVLDEALSLAEGAVSPLKQVGLSEERIEELLSKNQESVDVPLNPFVKEDREFIAKNMSEEAQAWLDETAEKLNPEQLSHALPMVSAVLPLLATSAVSGTSDRAVLDEALTLTKGVKATSLSAHKITGRVTLGDLSQGKKPWGGQSGVSTQVKSSWNFFDQKDLTQAAQASHLNEGETASLTDSINRLNMPPMDRKEFNSRLTESLGEYRNVQMSTGMTVSDLVSSVDSMSMKRPDAARFANKEVYFESQLGEVLAGAAVALLPTKTMSAESLFQPLAAESNGQTVQALAHSVYTKAATSSPVHALPKDEMMSYVSQAMAGQWEGVPASVRPAMVQAMGSGGVGSSLQQVVSNMPAMESFSQSARPYSSSIRPMTRQIPMGATNTSFQGSGYRNLGYKMNPNRGGLSAIHKNSNPALVSGNDTGQFHTPPAHLFMNAPGLQTSGRREQPITSGVVKATMGGDRASQSWATNSLPHASRMGSSVGGSGMGSSAGRAPMGAPPAPQFSGQMSPQAPAPQNRMDRINANYQSDKAAVGNGMPTGERMLARSASHDVGGAGGSGESKKASSNLFIEDVIDDLREDF